MKKLTLIAAILLCSITMSAQSHDFEVQVDLNAGLGLSQKSGFATGIDAAVGFLPTESLFLGFGAGFDFLKAAYTVVEDEITKNGEFIVPLFLRGKYTLASMTSSTSLIEPFVMADLGYNASIGGIKMGNGEGIKGTHNIKGLFVEPKIGISINNMYNIGLGLRMQHFNYKYFSAKSAEAKVKGAFASDLCLHFGLVF